MPQPQWRPISFLPTLATHIDGMLEADQEQYHNLLQAKDKPYILDDYTVGRVKNAFTTAKNDLPLFDEQLRRWGAEKTTDAQRQEIIRLKEQMQKLHEAVDQVLALADELAKSTIEKQLAKSDEELGIEYLMRMLGGEQKL
ncbi:hypothetical protein [Ktedonobacter racemifer]|uniref:Uncharacterized protein n=1 Tax=Ktedonobacter racemifer DSM 44963 TaxID=485913 RepID=D6U032_KTERA|nr:hypothetical protein [Ktedonobacter racemifer]EFH82172.1 conserved hypothetical protein [Ktedonobacter racemifer DSM 44963]